MKTNTTLILSFLLVLITFFAATSPTGEFSRNLLHGELSEGGIQTPAPYYVRTTTISSVGPFFGQPSRMKEYLHNDLPDTVGDLNGDESITVDDCRALGRLNAHRKQRSTTRIAHRFNTDLSKYYDERGDWNQDGIISEQDIRLCYAYLAESSETLRSTYAQQQNCGEIGDSTCMNEFLYRCMADQVATRDYSGKPVYSWVQEQKPDRRARCISRASGAFYSFMSPQKTLYEA